MKHKHHILLLLALSLLLSIKANAQIYPIQINTQLTPPYSLKLSEYVEPGTNRIGVNLLLTDLNKPEYYIRLVLHIEGDGITITTSPTFDPGPIIMQGGVPEYYSSSGLYEWFQPENLQFSGYSKSDYLRSGRLPEGVYRISFRAYDYNKRTLGVSNSHPITAWLLLNDPPVINMPFPDYKVEHIDPQNIVFQWTPRHTGSPNSAFTTEYELSLVEIWPKGRNPNDAIFTSIPIFQTTTPNTSFVYGLAEPFLEPGRQYAYRVQARDTEERDMFKNDGYSEVRMFTFGDECKPVTNIEAISEKFFEATVSWEPSFTQTSFSVRYRKADMEGAEWFEEETFLSNVKIGDLEASTKYEYQVMGYCGTYEGEYSDLKTFTTPEPDPSEFECGLSDDDINITNKEPLPVLLEGDYIWSGMFPFRITKANGGNGTFSGEGYATIPYLELIKLHVKFENIKINTDKEVYEGSITSIYNPESPFVTGIDLSGGNETTKDRDSSLTSTEMNDTIFTTDIDSVYISNNEIIIVNEDGTTDTIASTEDIKITDNNGDTWLVEDGQVLTGGGTGPGGNTPGAGNNNPAVADVNDIKIKVEFMPYSGQDYGYDQLMYDAHKPVYEQKSINGKTLYTPWKSLSANGADKVLVKITGYDTTITTKHVKYRAASGIAITPFEFEGKKDLHLLLLNGKTHEVTEGIEAYINYVNTSDTSTEKELVLAKLNTISYNKQDINLVIVPVNGDAGFTVSQFTTELNKIYKQSVVNWNISLNPVYNINTTDWDKDNDTKMNDGESGLLSKYSDEQNKFKRKYKSDRDVDKNTYYVFLLSNIASKTGLAGYMPVKSQYSFIYSGSINARTIAHELGHGAFRLWHTFSSESSYTMAEKSSDNLMDYNDGSRLHKYQWDFIHDPQSGIYLFQDEDEGAYSTGGINKNTLVFSGDNYQEIATRINEESVCYFGNADKAKIKFEYKPIFEGKEDYPKTIYIKTEVEYNGQVINNTSEVNKAGKDKKSGGYACKKEFSFELESKVTHYDNISIKCYWSTDGESNWQQIMEYSPIIYTTLKLVANDQYGNKCNLDERLLYFTCSLSPDYSETSVFNTVWSKIEELKLNTTDFGLNRGIPIGYYTSHLLYSFDSLMKYNSGICNAFQNLMIKALQIQGVSARRVQISLGSDESFLVKAWKYTGEGSSGNLDYPFINYFDLNSYQPPFLTSGKYRWLGTPEVERTPEDANNLGGQNNNKPLANFYIHQVVEYNGRIYDPSYGKSFDNVEKWKEESIDGIYIKDEGRLRNGAKVNAWLIKKNK